MALRGYGRGRRARKKHTTGAKARDDFQAYAALKGRSSTVVPTFVTFSAENTKESRDPNSEVERVKGASGWPPPPRRAQLFFLRPATCSPETFFFTTISPGFGFSLCGPHCLPGLTAYLLNVKVFVWFNPSILVTGTHPLPRGVER